MLRNAIVKAFEVAAKRGWDRTYWAIDLHETMMPPTHTKDMPTTFYPGAIEVLQELSRRPDVVLIMYTSSTPVDIHVYNALLRDNGVWFNYFNSNPEVPDTDYADFSSKFYFNVLLDDKAGFEPGDDWEMLKELLTVLPVLGL